MNKLPALALVFAVFALAAATAHANTTGRTILSGPKGEVTEACVSVCTVTLEDGQFVRRCTRVCVRET